MLNVNVTVLLFLLSFRLNGPDAWVFRLAQDGKLALSRGPEGRD